MKRIVLLIVLFLPLIGFPQKVKGTISLLDGTTISGIIKITSNEIKYWANEETKPEKYDYQRASSALLDDEKGGQVKYEYVYFDFQKKPILLKVEIEGYLTLYSDSSVYFSGGPAGMTGAGMGMGAGSSSTYYLKKRNDELGQWFLCYGYISKITFDKVIERYFNDCKAIQQKVKGGEFKKKHYKEIVNFYNQNCVPK
jgi:hypothetical protein